MQSERQPAGDTEVRVRWSPWTRCESSFAFVLAPREPGVFAVAEELVPAIDDATGIAARRVLAVFHVGCSDDLGRDLARLFAVGSPVHDRLAEGRCYLRYAPLPDAAVRDVVFASLEQWMAASTEAATGIVQPPAPAPRSAASGPTLVSGTAAHRWPEGF